MISKSTRMEEEFDSILHPSILKEFHSLQPIGAGSTSIVLKGISNNDQKPYAIKLLNTQSKQFKSNPDTGVDYFFKEMLYLNRLRHENIMPVLSFDHDFSKRQAYFTMPLYIPLRELINQQNANSRDRPLFQINHRRLLHDVARALEYVREKENLSHNDIKPENIFYNSETGGFILGDWTGCMKTHSYLDPDFSEATLAESKMLKYMGTPIYAAPELFDIERGKDNKISLYKADIYSLGLVILEACGLKRDIFHGLNQQKMETVYDFHLKAIMENFENLVSDTPLINVIKHMLFKNPVKRASIKEILNFLSIPLEDPFKGSDIIPSFKSRQESVLLATGSWDRTIKLIDINTNQVVHSFTGLHNGNYLQLLICLSKKYVDNVLSLNFSKDGSLLASGSADNTIKLIDMTKKQPVETFEGSHNRIFS